MGWLDEFRRLVAAREADPRTPEIPPLQSHGGWPGRAAIEAFNATMGIGEAAKNMATTDKRYTQGELERLAAGSSMALLGTSRALPTNPGGASAGMFMGRLARDAPHPKMDEAELRRAAGEGSIPIHRSTGVDVSDPHPAPKWEISDQGIGFDPKLLEDIKRMDQLGATGYRDVPLGQAMPHPELYWNYPQLENMTMRIGTPDAIQDMGRSRGFYQPFPSDPASYKPGQIPGWIAMNQSHVARNLTAPRTVGHEIGHAIQDIEGWPGGASPDWLGQQALLAMSRKASDVAKRFGKNSPEYHRLEALHAKYNSDPRIAEHVNYRLYQRDPGEAQARNIADRWDWDMAMRRATAPELSMMEAQPSELIMKSWDWRKPKGQR